MRLFLLLCDPCRIQTCNPHIRSVVLYSVELMDPEVSPLIGETGLRRKGHIPLVFEKKTTGAVVQLVRIPACHAVGREFESRPHRRTSESWFPFQS